MKSPREIVDTMMEKDAFSHWLGIHIESISAGHCTLQVTISGEMLNGFSIAHGGITYSMADSALAFASNAYGYKCVSIETSISHIRPTREGDILVATTTELHRGKKTAIYQVNIHNQNLKPVALFKGTVHISEDLW